MTPLVLVAVLQGLGSLVAPLPLVLSLALATIGWFWPGIALHRGRQKDRSDAGEALFTFFDLVVLERLANASAAHPGRNCSVSPPSWTCRRSRTWPT